MPTINREFTVVEGGTINLAIADDEVESYTYSVESRDGTAKLAVGTPDGTDDYAALHQSGGGSGEFSLPIKTVDDEVYEGKTAETFFIDYTAAITTLEDGDPPVPVVTPYSGVITVNIDDSADIPKLEIHELSIREDDKKSPPMLTITADHPATFDYTMHVVVGGIGDVEPTTYDVVMPAMSQIVSVKLGLVDDYIREASPTDLSKNFENVTVMASSEFGTTTSEIQIINDDGPIITVKPIEGSGIIAYEGYDYGWADVTLSQAVPYNIELIFTPSDPAAHDEVNLPQVIIPAGTTGARVKVLQATDDHHGELTEKISFTVTAIPSADEKVYFGQAGETTTTIDANVKDSIVRYLDKKGDMTEATEILEKILGVKNEFIKSLLKYSQDPDYSKFADSIEKSAHVLTVGLNTAPIVANYLNDRSEAEGKPNQTQLNQIAAIRAVVDFFDKTSAVAFGEFGSSVVAAEIIVAFGLTGTALPVLATVGAGLATAYVYEKFLAPYLKDAVSHLILLNYDNLERAPPPLSSVDSQDGGQTFDGDGGDNLFLVSSSAALVSEPANGGYDAVVASADFKLPSNVEAIFLTDAARKALGNELDNLVAGNAHDNVLFGGPGKDVVNGGDGNDFLAGQSDADVLTGGIGMDAFSGTIAELKGDRIADYEYGERILIAGGPTAEGAYRLEHTATDTLVQIDSDGDGVFESMITLSGVIAGALSIKPETDPSVTNDDSGAVYASLSIEQVGVVINGTNGPETLEGTPGDDELYGLGGDDVILGHEGDDYLIGGAGNDQIDGGSGDDTVDYTSTGETGNQGVTVNLSNEQYGSQAAHTATDTSGGTDSLTSIEDIFGTMRDDVFVSESGASYNAFRGLGGNDTIVGSGGNTWVYYHRDQDFGGTGGVIVNLSDVQQGAQAAHTAKDGFGSTDTITDVNRVRGTVQADVFYGNDEANHFQMLAGNDFVDGGDGSDLVDYSGDNRSGGALHGAFINLSGQAQASFLGTVAAHSAIGLFGDADTLLSIEEAKGSEFADVLIGNDAPEPYQGFWGLAGNDIITGGGENTWVYYSDDARFGGSSGVIVNLSDTERGGQAAHSAADGFGDTDSLTNVGGIQGTHAADVIYGNQERNMFELGAGDDIVDGGDGEDSIIYAYDNDGTASHGAFVNLSDDVQTSFLGTVGPHSAIDLYGNTDSLTSVENAEGSEFDDVLVAENAPDKYQGFWGYAGNDTIIGGGKNSWVYYFDDARFGGLGGVTVNLSDTERGGQAAHSATDGFGATDTLINVGSVKGTASADIFYGDQKDNQFELSAGNDFVDGGDGNDTVSYSFDNDGTATHGVLVNLSNFATSAQLGTAAAHSAIGLYGDIDTLLDIEEAIGSEFDDVLIGEASPDKYQGFWGLAGSDTIIGGGANTWVYYDEDASRGGRNGVIVNISGTLQGGQAAHSATDGFASLDSLVGVDSVKGTAFNDVIYGNENDNQFELGDGDDVVDGGDGIDTVNYRFDDDGTATHGALVNLSGQTFTTALGTVGPRSAIGLFGDADTFISIENATGSALGDYLIGNGQSNTLDGRAGDDTLLGGGGDDTLIGGRGSDVMDGGGGLDTVDYSRDVEAGATHGVTVNLLGNAPRVNLAADTAIDSFGDTDTVANIRNVIGTQFADVIYGGNHANTIEAGAGDDLLIGGLDNDVLDGGDGVDTVDYSFDDNGTATHGALVNLSGQTFTTTMGTVGPRSAIGLYGDIDTLVDIENVTGSAFADYLIGNGQSNTLRGGDGNDSLFGGDGSDTLIGGRGEDTMDGGGGLDTVDYGAEGGDRGVIVNLLGDGPLNQYDLLADEAIDTFGYKDKIPNVRHVIGTAFADIIYGGNHANTIKAGAGDDFLHGGVDDDNLYGGAGTDTADYTGNRSDYLITDNGDGSMTVADLRAGTPDGRDTVWEIEFLKFADRTVAGSVNAPPSIAGGDTAAAVVNENQTVVSTIVATDPNAGDTLSFAIAGANDAGKFTIDATTGNLSFVSAPDYESPGDVNGDNLYEVVVQVSDGLGGVDTQSIAVSVANLNDSAPVFTSGTVANVQENSGGVAYDADAEEADGLGALSYSLSGTDAARFDIDAVSGMVSFKAAPNFEAPLDANADNVYDIVVTASDGTQATNRTVAITVSNLNDNAPVFVSGGTATFAENATGTVYDANATDADGAGVTYVLSGTDAARFAIDSAGVVTFIAPPDFEAPGDAGASNVYDIVVTASDGTFATPQAVAITVTNVAEGGSVINGTAGGDTLNGTPGPDTISGLAGNDTLNGLGGNDRLVGGTGADLLNGGAGADMMQGGAGADTYVVDDAGDTVDESVPGSGGRDAVQSSISFSLVASATVLGGLEDLTLTGSAAINAVGNNLANVLIGNNADNLIQGGAGNDTLVGNGGNDTLDGGAGNDTMRGGAGNDAYVVDSVGDRIDESGAGGQDTIISSIGFSLSSGRVAGSVENLTLVGIANINAAGNALGNLLIGNGGDNILDGAAGQDIMQGAGGNDTYVVDDVNDIVDESTARAGGLDTVRTSLGYSLAASTHVLGQIENLVLTGNSDVDGTGNDADNTITGNTGSNILSGGAGNDVLNGNRGNDTLLGGTSNDTLIGLAGVDRLDGGSGADSMSGGTGNDTYVVDDGGDTIQENANEGRDTVEASLASFTLSDNVENLVYIGMTNFTGIGNVLNNTISGGAGSDHLDGGAGNDLLIGGAGSDVLAGGSGADQFIFNVAFGSAGVDTITDFVTRAANAGVHDRIVLDNASGMFSQLAEGTLSNAAFAVANGGQPQDASDRIVYDPTTGWLTYDSNGSAPGGNPIHFATLDAGLNLRAADFVVV